MRHRSYSVVQQQARSDDLDTAAGFCLWICAPLESARQPMRLQDIRARRVRIYRLVVDFDAGFVNNDNRKGAIPDPRIMPEPPSKLPAVLDGIAGCRKFQPLSVSDWPAILHLKIESSHHASCGR